MISLKQINLKKELIEDIIKIKAKNNIMLKILKINKNQKKIKIKLDKFLQNKVMNRKINNTILNIKKDFTKKIIEKDKNINNKKNKKIKKLNNKINK